MSIQSIRGMQFQKFLFVMCKNCTSYEYFFSEILPHLGKVLELKKHSTAKSIKQKTTSYFYTVQI